MRSVSGDPLPSLVATVRIASNSDACPARVSPTRLTAHYRNAAGYDDGRPMTMILPTNHVSGHPGAAQSTHRTPHAGSTADVRLMPDVSVRVIPIGILHTWLGHPWDHPRTIAVLIAEP